jgi:NitT/TauT family transport system permease protein
MSEAPQEGKRGPLRSLLAFFFHTERGQDEPPVDDGSAPAPEEEAAIPDLGELPQAPAPRSRLFRVRERTAPALRVLLGVLPFALFFVWWLWATAGAEPELRRISSTILPSPAEVISRLPELWYDSALMRNILLSLVRVLGGFAVAVLIALPLGIAMAAFSRIGATFGLVTALLSYLPIPAIVPLTMAWWKTGEEQKVGFLALATFAYLLPLVVRHIGAVDHKYLLSAYAQGAGSWQLVSRVLVPIALPDIFNALRLCLGIGWTYIVLAEVIKAGEGVGGVGNLIMVFQRRGHMEEVYLTVASIMIVGAILDRTCGWLSNRLFPYRAARGEG